MICPCSSPELPVPLEESLEGRLESSKRVSEWRAAGDPFLEDRHGCRGPAWQSFSTLTISSFHRCAPLGLAVQVAIEPGRVPLIPCSSLRKGGATASLPSRVPPPKTRGAIVGPLEVNPHARLLTGGGGYTLRASVQGLRKWNHGEWFVGSMVPRVQ